MKTEIATKNSLSPSPFRAFAGIEYFDFEEDFMESNMRCIPMIVRFKMDRVGIKLKLIEWSKFSWPERFELALKTCDTAAQADNYHYYLATLIRKYTGNEPTSIAIEKAPPDTPGEIPPELKENAAVHNCVIISDKWRYLTTLQRYALVKLCRPGHENKNFPRAMREFGMSQ